MFLKIIQIRRYKMPKVTFEIPIDIKDIVQKHTEIDWDKIC